MTGIFLLLLAVLGLVFLGLAAVKIPEPAKLSMLAAGLFFLFLAELLTRIPK